MLARVPGRFTGMILKTISAVLVGYMLFVFSSEARTEVKFGNLDHRPQGTKKTKKSTVHLYFADRDYNYLTAEQRVLRASNEPIRFAEAIIDALIKGPRKELSRCIPPGTFLRAIYITPDGICYVDLSEEVREKHPGGCNSELLTIYSIVNSLILNLPEIKKVKILVNGNEAQTLAGHCDLEFPRQANMLLIR